MLNDVAGVMRRAAIAFVLLSPIGALHAQKGSLTGSVFSSTGEKPIANAEVVMSDLNKSVRTDTLGKFQLAEIPPGSHNVTVRHVGYEPYIARLNFKGSEKVEADFLLDAITRLANVDVRANIDKRYAARLAEFDQRRKEGFGKFLGPEFFEQNETMTMSAIFAQNFGALRAVSQTNTTVAATSRGSETCPVQVYLNGISIYNGEMIMFDITTVHTSALLALEYFTPLFTPAELMRRPRGNTGGAGCGTLLIWTK